MPARSGRIAPTSLRGATRRGNLYQVAIVPNEAARQRREVATPSGLAMTSVFFGGFDGRMWTMAANSVRVVVSEIIALP